MKCFVSLRIAVIAVFIFVPRVLKAQKVQPPNIVFLLVDDMGYADVGCYGSSFYETPNIDALASGGMKFMNTYTAGSVCSPTRSSIMTGRYTVRTGVTDWIPGQKVSNTKLIQPETKLFLGRDEITFAELLKKGGYSTFYAGKWHLRDRPKRTRTSCII
ncbi:sulfatase-like hydrolase/transferase [Arcticibacter tournemirensis]